MIKFIAVSPRYKNSKITFVGNIACKELAEFYDKEFISEFIWVSPKEIFNSKKNIIKFSLRLKLKSFDTLICPVHSRNKELDFLLSIIGAKHNIVSKGDSINYFNHAEYLNSLNLYNELIDVRSEHNFEFYRNVDFINNLCGIDSQMQLKLNVINITSDNYIVIVPGASQDFRRWSTKKFANLMNKLSNLELLQNPYFFIIGSSYENKLAEEIIENILPQTKVVNMVGSLTLNEVVNIIGNSQLVISNETSTVHISAALKKKCICISNGNHFGRFNPYPKQISNQIHTIYPTDEFADDRIELLIQKYNKGSSLSIDLISEDLLLNKIRGILTNEL